MRERRPGPRRRARRHRVVHPKRRRRRRAVQWRYVRVAVHVGHVAPLVAGRRAAIVGRRRTRIPLPRVGRRRRCRCGCRVGGAVARQLRRRRGRVARHAVPGRAQCQRGVAVPVVVGARAQVGRVHARRRFGFKRRRVRVGRALRLRRSTRGALVGHRQERVYAVATHVLRHGLIFAGRAVLRPGEYLGR